MGTTDNASPVGAVGRRSPPRFCNEMALTRQVEGVDSASTQEPGIADAPSHAQPPPSFEALYRAELDSIAAFFARRSTS